MKLSIVIAFYNSHGAVARQAKYFQAMNLPDDVEFIFVDDGSNPAHRIEDYNLNNLRLHFTNDKRPWTQGLARNAGAALARGAYLFMTDIDHVISREAIEAARKFTGNKMIFRRKIAVLLEDGTLSQDKNVLKEYGYEKENLDASVHGNTWVMKKEIFDSLGGYAPETCTRGYHPARRRGDDCYFNTKWNRAFAGTKPDVGPDIYIFPIGRFHSRGELNPLGLFHNLSHEQAPQPLKS